VTTDVALKVLKQAVAKGWKLPKATCEFVERAIDGDVPTEVRGNARAKIVDARGNPWMSQLALGWQSAGPIESTQRTG
jgi:hypothetical protein